MYVLHFHPPTHFITFHFTTHIVLCRCQIQIKSFENGAWLTCHSTFIIMVSTPNWSLNFGSRVLGIPSKRPFSFSLAVGRDRRSEPHHRRPLPLEVCSVQLLLQRCGQKGEKTAKTFDFIFYVAFTTPEPLMSQTLLLCFYGVYLFMFSAKRKGFNSFTVTFFLLLWVFLLSLGDRCGDGQGR